MSTLPFVIRGVMTGLVDLNGIARFEENHVCLEFRTVHPLSKFLKSETREIRIPLADLEEAKFRSLFCLGFLILRSRNLTAFNSVPGATSSELRLRCRREYFAIAREFASRVNMSTVAQELKVLVAATNAQATPIPPLNRSEPENIPAVKHSAPTADQKLQH